MATSYPGMDKDAAPTVADLIVGGTQKGPGTTVPDPSVNKPANNEPVSRDQERR
jgi:hypothetical protein